MTLFSPCILKTSRLDVVSRVEYILSMLVNAKVAADLRAKKKKGSAQCWRQSGSDCNVDEGVNEGHTHSWFQGTYSCTRSNDGNDVFILDLCHHSRFVIFCVLPVDKERGRVAEDSQLGHP